MLTSSQVARARVAVEAQMQDTCVISKLVRSPTINEATGKREMVPTVVYTGRCKFKVAQVQVRDVDTQGQDLAVADGILSIPVDAPGSGAVTKDHVATITLAANDTATITAVIQAAHAQSFATARRFPIEVTT